MEDSNPSQKLHSLKFFTILPLLTLEKLGRKNRNSHLGSPSRYSNLMMVERSLLRREAQFFFPQKA